MIEVVDRHQGTEAFWKEVDSRLFFNAPMLRKCSEGFEIYFYLDTSFRIRKAYKGGYEVTRLSNWLRINDWSPIADGAKVAEVFNRILCAITAPVAA